MGFLFGILLILIAFYAWQQFEEREEKDRGGEDVTATPTVSKLPYKKQQYLFSKPENEFFRLLRKALEGQDLVVFGKVRLSDVLAVSGNKDRQKYWNKIQAKHVDFLICNEEYFNPLAAVELDDSSHERPDRVQRDDFLNKAFDSAELPLLRLPVRFSYSLKEVRQKVFEGLPAKYSKNEDLDMPSE